MNTLMIQHVMIGNALVLLETVMVSGSLLVLLVNTTKSVQYLYVDL